MLSCYNLLSDPLKPKYKNLNIQQNPIKKYQHYSYDLHQADYGNEARFVTPYHL